MERKGRGDWNGKEGRKETGLIREIGSDWRSRVIGEIECLGKFKVIREIGIGRDRK